ncbi:hypothetical protein K0O13_07990 [Mammaliicoccus sciuri]|uniref:hypothetical protein n=1 Tax=Mammaliicoccus sciuri TaxID=1296 RepID=UPI001C62EE81|nr:hypothetical protein [Mammaliicoccus sciuri]QYG30040.1 hypothetical protein K0O13_07990 [Mammaliicoccus sciuri]
MNKCKEEILERVAGEDLRKKVIILNKNNDLRDSTNRNVLILNITEEEFRRRIYDHRYPEYTNYLYEAAYIYDANTGNAIKNRGWL